MGGEVCVGYHALVLAAPSAMPTRGHYYLQHAKKNAFQSFCCKSPFLISLLCIAFLFFVYFFFRSSVSPPNYQILRSERSDVSETPILVEPCNYSDGMWIFDPSVRSAPYDHTCKEIFKGWNCIASGKSNGLDIIKWRWKPKGCDLPRFDPVRFLERFRNTNIGFVGDSLNRNMFVSLFCTLKQVSSEVKKWHPAGADRGFTFLKYNFTISYHRTNLLARYGRWSADANGGTLESLGYKEGFRVDVDIPDRTWAEAPSFHDILIFNTGHWWWAPSKFDPVKSPMLFFENGLPLIPPVPPHVGLDLVLRHLVSFVEGRVRPGGFKFFRSQSPRHFEGGDWDQGGSCQHLRPLLPVQVEELFSLKNNGTNVETRLVNRHLYEALKGYDFHILEVTRMSEFRADAHPSTAGGKKHDDCMHWCLPGVTDTWNDLFVAHLNNIKFQD